MRFDSIIFFVFFPLVLAGVFLFRKNPRARNAWLLAGSYLFYGWWDWRFLFLILLSSSVDFVAAAQIEKSSAKARRWLVASIVTNLGILFSFKYFGFFVASMNILLAQMGIEQGMGAFEVLLPVGVSFYTFQSMSYTIDVYRGETKAEKDPLLFALYVGFFPQLVAGPIERASRLFPQFARPSSITANDIQQGVNLIIWGLVKKVVLADNLARVVDPVFRANAPDWFAILVACYAFAFQIYFDFSGYTDMARGVARLMGFELSLNFLQPYLSRGPRDFWRRWHISLSQWLRDYLYKPLGGSRDGPSRTRRNLMLTMLLGGLWHGAAWPFLWWGVFHGLLLLIYRAKPLASLAEEDKAKGLQAFFGWFVFFHLCTWAWMLFRVKEMGQFVWFSMRLFSGQGSGPSMVSKLDVLLVVFSALLLFGSDWFLRLQRKEGGYLHRLKFAWAPQALLFTSAFTALIFFGVYDGSPFIYFQF